MDPMLVQYILFILAALIIIGAVVALNRWIYRHDKTSSGVLDTWVELDTKRPEAREDLSPSPALDDEEEEEVELHTRARQNGHHAESQKPQI